jgi:hypothetical protein
MTKLKDKIQNALDECRMLVLGAQILVGALYRTAFEPGFDRLPPSSQYLALGALAVIMVAVVVLLAPVPHHVLIGHGFNNRRFHHFILNMMTLALFPFALSLAAEVYVSVAKLDGGHVGLVAGTATLGLALFFWYGLQIIHSGSPKELGRAKYGRSESMSNDQDSAGTDLQERIRHVLTEARMVLPGVQALLGFQFITMVLDDFDKLPHSSQEVHLVSLCLMAISVVLLMTPAAYHRAVAHGGNTEGFYRFVSWLLIAAMIPLALGICGDFFVVVRKVTTSTELAADASAVLLVFAMVVWFGLTLGRWKANAT